MAIPPAIILLQDDKPVSEFAIPGDSPLTIGRSSGASVQVRDGKLSRLHCEVRATADGCFIRDLNSKNGTFVNGARITEARLRDGDRIQIGLTRFLFRGEPAPVAPPKTEATEIAPSQRCAACGRIVPADSLGVARQTGSRIYCASCLAANALLGRVIGGYEIVQILGRGGMGTVFKAEQLSMGRPVALKILHKELTADPDAVRRFLREARAGGQLSHPNIIRIYDMNQAEGYYFISMEYVVGGDVGSLLEREGPLPFRQVTDIACQTCAALAHAHGRGIIHRDVKPSNLLIGRDGLIKVTDLGLAKSLDIAGISSLTASATTLGTIAYTPPEQLANARAVDARADVYALGATCYHLVTGEVPFRAPTIGVLALAIRSETPKPLRSYRGDTPSDLEEVVARAMAKDPAHRFQTADEFLAALKAIKL